VKKLPEFIYLVTVDSEWPVSAIADDHPSTAERVEREVERRCQSGNVPHRSYVHVWRVPVAGAVEVELLPSAVVRPSLRERPGD
jgi:hypothetical protein